MVMPKFHEILLPFLELCEDKEEHKLSNVVPVLADELELTEEDRAETLNSGKSRFKNRVSWARTYLIKAGLIESKRWGHFNITNEGLKVLSENLDEITDDYLMKYPSFREFLKVGSSSEKNKEDVTSISELTPIERLENAYEEIKNGLAEELLETIMSNAPDFFEKLVVDLLLSMGYGGSRQDAGKVIGKVGDVGIDGVISEDRLGLEKIYIQAKRYNKDNVVGRPEIQKFVGALQGEGARKGVFITTSHFTPNAEEYAKSNLGSSVILIDGEKLTNLMIEFDVGVSTKDSYKIKQLYKDYFEM